jgi:hypothetical protein
MIPLYAIEGNKCTSLCGKTSSFYQLIPSDIEGVSDHEKQLIFDTLERDLINSEEVLKLYWLNNNLYINTFENTEINNCKTVSDVNPIKVFCNNENFKDIHFYENYFTIGNKYCRVLSVKELPNTIEMFDVLTWPNFVLNISRFEKQQAKNKVNLKRKLHYSNLFKGIRDIESESAYGEAEELLEAISRDEKGLFQIEMFYILEASTKSKLDDKTNEFIKYYEGIDGKLLVEERGLSYFYKEMIPGVPPKLKRKILCPSDYLSYLIPFHHDYIHETGIKFHSTSQNEIKLDLFNENALNYNVLVTGPSGQGKSMLANKVLSEELKRGTKSVILDLGNSFLKTTKFNKGTIFSQKINPLQFKCPKFLKEFVLSVIDEPLTKKDTGRLYEQIRYILENNKDIAFNPFLDELEKSFTGIKYYFSEIQEYFTDEYSTLKDLTYCDFTIFPESMKAPLIIYLIEYFKQIEGRKILLFDECWHLLNKNADYIAECFRTFRKHNASAIAISQNLDDFYSTTLGKVIIQNTYWKVLFRQELGSSEFINQHIADQVRSVQSLKGEYSEFILLCEFFLKQCRYIPTKLEYELFSSNANDNNKLNAYLKKIEDIQTFNQGIINYTKLKYPFSEVKYA